MGQEPYQTVVDRASAEIRVRGSRFIGFVDHVKTVDAAERTIVAVSEEHPDATHVVPAYRVRADPFREYASDDGEPAGSAGKPVLSVLQGANLENVIALVVRYYGGTNLGVGGLVRAYQGVTSQAIESAEVAERRPQSRLALRTTYDDSGTVRSILEGSEATFSASYEETVTITVEVPTIDESTLRDRLLSATSGRIEILDEWPRE